MQYIPLNDFFGFLEKPVKVYSLEELNEFSTRIFARYQQGDFITVEKKQISVDEAIAFCAKLNHPGIVVFDQWICLHKSVFNLLIHGKVAPIKFDVKKHQDHFLFSDFQRFISPFLADKINQNWPFSDTPAKYAIATALPLLDSSYRREIQHVLRDWILVFTSNQLEMARDCQSEKALAIQLQSLFSEELLGLLNAFYPSHYDAKVYFVEETLKVIHWTSCSPRMGIWITNQLKKIHLHESHLEAILEIQRVIRATNFSKDGSTKSKNSAFLEVKMWYLILVVACFTGLIYWIFSDPLESKNPAKTTNESQSSLEYFTPKERKEIDSLLGTIQPKSPTLPKNSTDQTVFLPPSNFATIFRKPFQNSTAEQFYVDCKKDQQLIAKGMIKNCDPLPKKKAISSINANFQPLKKHQGNTSVFIQNESKYQLLVLVFKNEGKEVFAQLVNPAEKGTFQLNSQEILLFIPGNDWAKFDVEKLTTKELPSASYTHHFCVQDANLMAMLNAPYRLKKDVPKSVKIMVAEELQSDEKLVILDMDEVLEQLNTDENTSN